MNTEESKENKSSNTGGSRKPGTFVKGDPRINRKGAPQGFHKLRQVINETLAENVQIEVKDKNGKKVKKVVTRLQAIVLDQANSSNPLKQQNLLSYGFGKAPEHAEAMSIDRDADVKEFALPADLIAPEFLDPFRDIKNERHNEYVFRGGRGSTKSSFISLVFIYLIKKYPEVHGLITRQVQNTLRDSVYSQMVWAIGELGLSEEFHCTVSPLQIEYIPTGQTIYFRGADDPGKIKSIKPAFGYIGILWFEELDQFAGPESIRKIEQSVIRGGEIGFIFKSFNPPRTSGNWANKYVQIPKENQYQHLSNYLSVPKEWLGSIWLAEAEHLKNINPEAYEHEYLGVVNGIGGMVFNNVKIEAIPQDVIDQFDNIKDGLDFGWYPDPADYIKCHYDAARLTLYIFSEVRKYKHSNKEMHEAIKTEGGYRDEDVLICDSAEPKSVDDYRAFGARARGAEKGKDSVKYSYKWLQSLKAIVIDNVRAPYAAQEFIDCAYEQTKDGEFISEVDDSTGNHSIDATRYATNVIWKRRGE